MIFLQLLKSFFLSLPAEKKFPSPGQDPAEQMQREAGGVAALGFDLAAAWRSLSLQRRREKNQMGLRDATHHRRRRRHCGSTCPCSPAEAIACHISPAHKSKPGEELQSLRINLVKVAKTQETFYAWKHVFFSFFFLVNSKRRRCSDEV